MTSIFKYIQGNNRKNTDIIIGYFNHYATKILRLSAFFVLVLFSVNSIDAQKALREQSFPVMETRRYAFMDAIVQYIKGTDLEMIYRTSGLEETSGFLKEGYIYNLSVYSYDTNEKKVDFFPNGSYHIDITIYTIIGSDDGYFFNYRGLPFFSDTRLRNFMVRQCGSKNCKSFLNFGIGFHWFFDIDKGNVDKAYALYSECVCPLNAYDLKTEKVIPYSEFDAAFYNIQ